MEKMQKPELMDKIPRELDDLKHSQTSVLKKISGIEVDNINPGVALPDKKLPDIHEEVDSSVQIATALQEEFQAHRDKFYTDSKLEALVDPTA